MKNNKKDDTSISYFDLVCKVLSEAKSGTKTNQAISDAIYNDGLSFQHSEHEDLRNLILSSKLFNATAHNCQGCGDINKLTIDGIVCLSQLENIKLLEQGNENNAQLARESIEHAKEAIGIANKKFSDKFLDSMYSYCYRLDSDWCFDIKYNNAL